MFLSKNQFILIADECGEYSTTRGYWDYCLYKDISKPDYLGLNWEEKTNMIINKLRNEPSPREWTSSFSNITMNPRK